VEKRACCEDLQPKEKWCLMFDKGGARHGIRTTNFAEVYHCVLRGSRPLPLVDIIEFFISYNAIFLPKEQGSK
jgi:hypothetical protein